MIRNSIRPLRCLVSNYHKLSTAPFSASSSPASQIGSTSSFRTSENNPTNHNENHLAQFFMLDPTVADGFFKFAGFNDEQKQMFKIMRETNLMVRSPALELISYLKKTDFTKPVNRYVLYGKFGNGKTFTMNHVINYAYNQKYLIIHVDNVITKWFNKPSEVSPSESRPGRLDFPVDAAMWLQQFRAQNAALLHMMDMKVSKKYTWSVREVTEQGEPLVNVIEHGINRMKHASDCVAVLLKELTLQSGTMTHPILVACDVANTLYQRCQYLRYPDLTEVAVENTTLGRAFRKLITTQWTNGAVVAVVDSKPYYRRRKAGRWMWTGIKDEPKSLLGEEGFDDLDPFIPILVPKLNDKELHAFLMYYHDRKFLTRKETQTDEGMMQLKAMCARSPHDLFTLCQPM